RNARSDFVRTFGGPIVRTKPTVPIAAKAAVRSSRVIANGTSASRVPSPFETQSHSSFQSVTTNDHVRTGLAVVVVVPNRRAGRSLLEHAAGNSKKAEAFTCAEWNTSGGRHVKSMQSRAMVVRATWHRVGRFNGAMHCDGARAFSEASLSEQPD